MSASLFGRRVRSLRRLLLLLVSVAILLIWAAAAALSYRQARHEVQELMDGQMAQSAALLLAQATHAPERLGDVAAEMAALRGARQRRNELTLEFQIERGDGSMLVRSPHAPTTALSGKLGYANIVHGDESWRSLILATANGEYRILVAQSVPLRDKEALEIARKTVLPLGLFMPLLLGLIYFSVRRGLKPLDDLAAQVSARSSENLQALDNAVAPLEAQPLVEALNRLLLRLGATLENERRFTADAAHELRTPLAAVRVQAQVALINSDPAEQRHALQQVLAGADRATRLVEQLLRLARLDPLARLPDPRAVDVVQLARSAVARWGGPSPARAGDLHLEVAERAVEINGDPDLLEVALRNLIDNAMRYTPAGSSIRVCAGLEHGEPVLGVKDDGPGVPAEELPKLIERFYRGRDITVEGSGLGLAIVRRIAELHGARLEIANIESGGFAAQLRWIADGRHA